MPSEFVDVKPRQQFSNGHNPFANSAVVQNNFTSSPNEMLKNVRKRMQERLAVIKEVNHGHSQELDRLKLDSEECQKTAKSLVDTKQLEAHYYFFQSIYNYVRDLIDCLNEKVPEIDGMEERIHEMWKKQSAKLIKRR